MSRGARVSGTAPARGRSASFISRLAGASPLRGAGGPALLAAFTAQNVANLLFHVGVSRLVGPMAYGGLVSLLTIHLVLMVPVNAAQIAVAQLISRADYESPGFPTARSVRNLQLRMAATALVAFSVVAALSPTLRGFLHLSSSTPVMVLGAIAFPLFLGIVPRGVLLGVRCFRQLAVALVVGSAARLAVGIVLSALGSGITGAMLAVLVGEGVTTLIALKKLRSPQLDPEQGFQVTLSARNVTGVTAAFGSFWLLVGMDSFLARHYLSSLGSGYYGAAATAARAVLFLPGAVALVIFPTLVRTEGRGPEARRSVLEAAVVVIVAGGVAAGLLAAFPGAFVIGLFGGKYRPPAQVVGILGASAIVFGLINVFQLFHIARRSTLAYVPAAGVVGAAVSIALNHNSATRIALTMLIVSAAVASVMSMGLTLRRNTDRGASHRSDAPNTSPPIAPV